MVLFPKETKSVKNLIKSNSFVQVKSAIDVLIQKALDDRFDSDGLLIKELLHLKVHINAYLGIGTEEEPWQEFPNSIKPNQIGQKEQSIRIIDRIRDI